jgi:PHAX RNA-binding domain-containing protein
MSKQEEPPTEGLAPADRSEENTQVESRLPLAEKREPSQYETAMMIADRLGEEEEARRKHIISLVQTLGRTQAQTLLDETLKACEQGESMNEKRMRTASEVFCDLAYTKGRLKARQVWGSRTVTTDEHTEPHPPGNKVVTRKIGKRLGETNVNQSILLKHIVSALGQVQAWALMLDALEIEAHGGMMILSEARQRTVGGIFLYLVSTRGIPGPGKALKRYPPKGTQKPLEPGEQSAKQ